MRIIRTCDACYEIPAVWSWKIGDEFFRFVFSMTDLSSSLLPIPPRVNSFWGKGRTRTTTAEKRKKNGDGSVSFGTGRLASTSFGYGSGRFGRCYVIITRFKVFLTRQLIFCKVENYFVRIICRCRGSRRVTQNGVVVLGDAGVVGCGSYGGDGVGGGGGTGSGSIVRMIQW